MKERKSTRNLISVIVPAYKQEKLIQKNLLQIKNTLDQTRYNYEIIVVVDGMDDATYEKAKKVQSNKIKVFGYEKNCGKGYAIRFGMNKSQGHIVGFIDSGMDLNPNGLSLLLEHFEWYGADIIVGSKLHPVSKVNYPFQRRILSIGYRTLTSILFGLKVKDTQVGMKFFKRQVLKSVLPRLLVKTFAFDIELLAVAYHLGYKKIYEAPIELKFKNKSSIGTFTSDKFWKIILHMLWDTLAVFYRLKILRYYDIKSKRKWRMDPELNYKVNIG